MDLEALAKTWPLIIALAAGFLWLARAQIQLKAVTKFFSLDEQKSRIEAEVSLRKDVDQAQKDLKHLYDKIRPIQENCKACKGEQP